MAGAAYKFTPEQVQLMRGFTSTAELARRFGCSTMPIRRWRTKYRGGFLPASAFLPVPQTVEQGGSEEHDPLSEEELLRDEVRRLKSERRKDDKDSRGEERVVRAIEGALAAWTPPRAVQPNWAALTKTSSGKPHHAQIALWSDWHAGEVIKHDQMGGLKVAFNWQILEDRVSQLVTSMLAFRKVSPDLTRLCLWLLGDMASGFIHGLAKTNELPEMEQYVKVGGLIAEAVCQLSPHYPQIDCAGIVGNHPRTDKEPASKDVYNSGDWVAYEFARALTRHLDNVTWEIPRGGMLVREVAGKNFLLWHGDGVRSSMPGVPWGGIMRRVNVLKDTFAEEGVRIDFVVVGHFHQRCIVPNVYMNGSLVGKNQYGLKNFGGGERARQLLLEFDEKRGRETAIKNLSLEDA